MIENLDECPLRLRLGKDHHRNGSVAVVTYDESVKGYQIIHSDSLGLNYVLRLSFSLHYVQPLYREVPAPSLQEEAPSMMS